MGVARQHRPAPPGEIVHLITDPAGNDASQIAYLDVATGHEEVVSHARATDAVWTSDGVVYMLAGGMEIRRFDGVHDTTFAVPHRGELFGLLAVSQRRDRIAVPVLAKGTNRLCLYTTATQVGDCFEANNSPNRPAFGTDDRYIYYGASDGIHRHELATGSDEMIIRDADPRGGLTVAADGSRLVYSTCSARGQILDVSQTPPAPVVSDPDALDASVNAGVVVWTRSVRGIPCLLVRDKGGERQLTDPTYGPVFEPALSPDGRWVAFRVVGQRAGIRVKNLALTEPRIQPISDDEHDRAPRWLGQDLLAFARVTDTGGVTIVNAQLSTGLLALGDDLEPVPARRRRQPHARDGSEPAVLDRPGHRRTPSPGPVIGVRGLVVHDPTTSPDGQWLAFTGGDEGARVFRMRLVPPGKLEQVGRLDDGRTAEGARITDEGHVIVSTQTWVGDLFAVPARQGSPF